MEVPDSHKVHPGKIFVMILKLSTMMGTRDKYLPDYECKTYISDLSRNQVSDPNGELFVHYTKYILVKSLWWSLKYLWWWRVIWQVEKRVRQTMNANLTGIRVLSANQVKSSSTLSLCSPSHIRCLWNVPASTNKGIPCLHSSHIKHEYMLGNNPWTWDNISISHLIFAQEFNSTTANITIVPPSHR